MWGLISEKSKLVEVRDLYPKGLALFTIERVEKKRNGNKKGGLVDEA